MTTARELADWIGREVWWHIVPPERRQTEDQDVTIPATILDARQAYGRMDFRLQPVHGTGSAWVSTKFVEVRSTVK